MNIIETNLDFKQLSCSNNPMMIVLHHSDSKDMSVFDIHKFHAQLNGWSGIGYHFFVTKEGEIYRGRPENVVGSHCKGFNENTIGICAQGNYMTEDMPHNQKQAIIDLCTYLCSKYKLGVIKAHKELKPTLCPGIKYPLKEIVNSALIPPKAFYTVKKGDTLWNISSKFKISVEDLKRINNLNSNMILLGQKLRIL